MGALFIAEQLSTGRRCALKLMHPRLVANETMRKRFVQEARVSASIESDHVVEVIAAGVDERTGVPWLAMELLSGKDLAAHLEESVALSAAETHVVTAQMCHGLAAAHLKGIVHRDLKPENLFLANSRQAGVRFQLKILDLGIAKVMAAAAKTATQSLGTPLWMAPEQSSAGGHITPATDVWAIGLIVYRMLTGRSYWRRAELEAFGLHALLREVVMDPLVSASARAMEKGALAALPAGFDAWFARCVVRDSARRFRDAAEAFETLEPLLVDPFSDGRVSREAMAAGAEEVEPDEDASSVGVVARTIEGVPLVAGLFPHAPSNEADEKARSLEARGDLRGALESRRTMLESEPRRATVWHDIFRLAATTTISRGGPRAPSRRSNRPHPKREASRASPRRRDLSAPSTTAVDASSHILRSTLLSRRCWPPRARHWCASRRPSGVKPNVIRATSSITR